LFYSFFSYLHSRIALPKSIAVLFCAIGLSASSSPHVFAQTLRTVVLSGPDAPGLEPGYRIFAFNETPAVNDAGQVAFNAILLDPPGRLGDLAMWSEGTGTLELISRKGRQAPGTEVGVTFNFFSKPSINAIGQSGFLGGLTGPGVTSENDSGIWVGNADGLSLLVRKGDPAPGIGPNVIFGGINDPFFNEAGRIAFSADFIGPGVTPDDTGGIWTNRTGNLTLVARRGRSAPGASAGVNFNGFSEARFNDIGQTAFFASLTGLGVRTSNDGGYWSEGSGELRLIVREGDPVPTGEPGVNFNLQFFSYPGFNNAGQTAFRGPPVGAGVTALNDSALWSEGKGSLALVAREGSAAPGTGAGVTFDDFFSSPVINGAGQTAFVATLKGDAVTTANRVGLWTEADGDLALVARTGDAAPGTEPGVTFGNLVGDTNSAPVLNAAGQVAFHGRLTGSGITTSNDAGIWAQDITGAVTLIAREGDLIEVNPGDFRRASGVFFRGESGLEDGRRAGFNERGELAFVATFDDGSSGIFVSDRVAVPELSEVHAWTGGDGMWSDPANWNPAGTPAGNWIAKVQTEGDSVAVNANSAVRQIMVEAVEGTAELRLNAGTLRATRSVEVNNGGALHFNGGRLVTPAVEVNGGDVFVAGTNAGYSPIHLNSGNVLVKPPGSGFGAPVRLTGGQMTIESGSSSPLRLDGPLTYAGTSAIEVIGTAELKGTQVWEADSVLTVRGGVSQPTNIIRFDLDHSDRVSVQPGAMLVNMDTTLELAGTRTPLADDTDLVNVTNNSMLLVSEGEHALGDLTGQGDLVVAAGASLTTNEILQDHVTVGGRLTIRPGSGTSVISGLSFDEVTPSAELVQAVPEPTTIVLVAILLVALALRGLPTFRRSRSRCDQSQ
jgi:hypothetical protein